MPVLALVMTLLACADRAPADRSAPALIRGYPRGELQIATGERIRLNLRVEIAETPGRLGTGLMGIKKLPEDAGMVFLMNGATRGGFYMKDTLLPLDIAFWDADQTIVDILQMEPCTTPTCPTYTPEHEYIAAVEVGKGVLARHGVTTGDRVILQRLDPPRSTDSRAG